MATISTKRLVSGSLLTASSATYYTVPAGTSAIVQKVTFVNNDTSPRTVTLYYVPSGGSSGTTNIVVNAATIFPNETWSPPDAVGHVLEAGGTIRALASSASVVTMMVSGVEIV